MSDSLQPPDAPAELLSSPFGDSDPDSPIDQELTYASALEAALDSPTNPDSKPAEDGEEEDGDSFVYAGKDSVWLREDDDTGAPITFKKRAKQAYNEELASILGSDDEPEQAVVNGGHSAVGELARPPSPTLPGSPPRSPSAPSQSATPASPTPSNRTNDTFPALSPSKAHNISHDISRASSHGSLSSFPRRPASFHPQISRLRSSGVHPRITSSSTYSTALEGFGTPEKYANGVQNNGWEVGSRRSSASNLFDHQPPPGTPSDLGLLSATPNGSTPAASTDAGPSIPAQDTTRWTPLRRISQRIYPPPKAAQTAVGAPVLGSPTCIAVSGVIAVGTTRGWVTVFDFNQNLRCVCGTEAISQEAGPVTAVALSQDHTFVAVGHAKGWIHLYALNKPSTPARSVPPTTMAMVATGRKEGHLEGTPIRSVGFVGMRHTAIVSSDERGLAFYHALGKVLGLASTDIIRMLGRYPEPGSAAPSIPGSIPSAMASAPPTPSLSVTSSPALGGVASPSGGKGKKPSTILALAPVPLGPAPHPSDALALAAILTPTKLVVVGIKPAARTWWRTTPARSKEGKGDLPPAEPGMEETEWGRNGVLSWFPAMPPSTTADLNATVTQATSTAPTPPTLAFGWGHRVRFVRLAAASSVTDVIEFVELSAIECDTQVLAVGWYSERIVYVLTRWHIEVWDIQSRERLGRDTIDPRSIVSYAHSTSPSSQAEDARCYASSFRMHKQKLFILTATDLRAGALLSWADRILTLMQPATILSAIELTTAYMQGLSDASTITLPSDEEQRQEVVLPKLREILNASLSFVFSEDRLRDGTHADGAAALSLFEGLVGTCVRACLATGDADWLFDELFERYESAGLEALFLDRIEPFVLAGAVHALPPSVSQRLIRTHAERGTYDAAQRIIWHVDPAALDVEQALSLCQREGLYDALVYVYNRAMRDYVGPMVELLVLVRKIMQGRRTRPSRVGGGELDDGDSEDEAEDSMIDHGGSFNAWAAKEDELEKSVPNAYKVFAYLAQALTGRSYPSGDALPFEEAVAGRNELYSFLFAPTTVTWPAKGGKPVLTSDEDSPEPSFPYLRILLRFDAEAVLDALDLALEESYLDDPDIPDRPIDRQKIADTLLEVMQPRASFDEAEHFTTVDRTFLHIFLARNLPKYPQFIHLEPATLHEILLGLASDPDQSTTEDRQLGVEYLLSTYTPPDFEAMIERFEQAGFFRVLRTIYRGERKWANLARTYLRDPDVSNDVFALLAETLSLSTSVKGASEARDELAVTILDAVPHLVQASETGLQQTADLVDRFLPQRHQDVLDALAGSPWRQFAYLRWLLEPAHADAQDEAPTSSPEEEHKERAPSTALDTKQRLAYLDLLAGHEPAHVIRYLEADPNHLEREAEALAICERKGAYDALVWALDRKGDTRAALEKADNTLEIRSDLLVNTLRGGVAEDDEREDGSESETPSADQIVHQMEAIAKVATAICVSRTAQASQPRKGALTGEELWFSLLSSLVATVRAVRVIVPAPPKPSDRSSSYRRVSGASVILRDEDDPLSAPRPLSVHAQEVVNSLIPKALSSLVSTTNNRQVSFPNLMRRLIDSHARSPAVQRSYVEFRAIVSSMLDSYAFEGDLLALTGKLVAQDLFEVVEQGEKERKKGWRPSTFRRDAGEEGNTSCAECGESVWGPQGVAAAPGMARSASVSMVVETLGLGGVPRPAKRGSLKGKEVLYPDGQPHQHSFVGGTPLSEEPGQLSGVGGFGLGEQGAGGVVVGRDGRVVHLRCHLQKVAGGGGEGGMGGYRMQRVGSARREVAA